HQSETEELHKGLGGESTPQGPSNTYNKPPLNRQMTPEPTDPLDLEGDDGSQMKGIIQSIDFLSNKRAYETSPTPSSHSQPDSRTYQEALNKYINKFCKTDTTSNSNDTN